MDLIKFEFIRSKNSRLHELLRSNLFSEAGGVADALPTRAQVIIFIWEGGIEHV